MKNNKDIDKKWFSENFWNKVRSIDQLKAAIIHHGNIFADNGKKNYFTSRKKLKPTPPIRIKTLTLSFCNASNTHYCPHNGITNWDRNKDLPTSYLGWVGRFGYFVQSYKDQTYYYPGGSDLWNNTRINTGTGGGGGSYLNYEQYFEYDVILFADDWPLLKLEYEKAITLTYLKTQTIDNYNSLNEIVNKNNPVENYFSDATALKVLDSYSI